MLHIRLASTLARSLVLIALTLTASAQDYWTPARIAEVAAADAGLSQALPSAPASAQGPLGNSPVTPSTSSFTSFDPLAQLLEEATFLTVHQVKLGLNAGGMREGEALPNIIQTDNTTESIWVWSRYRELTGDGRFDVNMAKAWGYLNANPAWLEEGGGGLNGYYRIYNCAWGLVAEGKYRAVTGDTSRLAYAQQCAQYLKTHFLSPSPVNTMIKGWAAGALYDFGSEQGDSSLIARAVQLGDIARAAVEADPALLSSEAWAMSGGVILWGVLNSTFRAGPGGKAWAETYAPLTKEWDPGGTWSFAHNGWYALGRDAAWEVTANPAYLTGHYDAQLKLLSKDTDDDGGIQTQKSNTAFEDETWVSNYLMFMGTQRVSEAVDVAVATDDFSLQPGEAWTVEVTLASQDPLNVLLATARLELAGPGLGPIPVVAPRSLMLAPLGITPTYTYSVPLGVGTPAGVYTLTFTGATEVAGVVETSQVSIVVP